MANCLTLKKSNCKNCYKCIRHCPVKAIRFSGNQAHIIGNECILCGHCFVVCPQNAKEIVDGTEKARVLLQSGDPVVVSLAPSFIANYEGVGIESMRRALRKLGFFDVEETAIGATIVKTEYERMLREEERDPYSGALIPNPQKTKSVVGITTFSAPRLVQTTMSSENCNSTFPFAHFTRIRFFSGRVYVAISRTGWK